MNGEAKEIVQNSNLRAAFRINAFFSAAHDQDSNSQMFAAKPLDSYAAS